MVLGDVKEARLMKSTPKWVQYVAIGVFAWVTLPFLIPLVCLYCVVRVMSTMVMGNAIQEVHNEK
tara:strand:- start:2861 stop:3055 length:195 start_codon:yes stop_codon:yes gene_type:complete